jgi:cell division protein FtsL
MTKINATLALAVVASSLYLVKTSHDSRQLFAAVDRARTEEARLDADLKRLEAEREQQATTQRVERHARERLHMRPAHPAVTQYVQDPAAPGGTATASALPRGGATQATTSSSAARGAAR